MEVGICALPSRDNIEVLGQPEGKVAKLHQTGVKVSPGAPRPDSDSGLQSTGMSKIDAVGSPLAKVLPMLAMNPAHDILQGQSGTWFFYLANQHRTIIRMMTFLKCFMGAIFWKEHRRLYFTLLGGQGNLSDRLLPNWQNSTKGLMARSGSWRGGQNDQVQRPQDAAFNSEHD